MSKRTIFIEEVSNGFIVKLLHAPFTTILAPTEKDVLMAVETFLESTDKTTPTDAPTD